MRPRTLRPRRLVALATLCALAVVAVVLNQRLVRNWEAQGAEPAGLDPSLAADRAAVARLDPDLRDALWLAAVAARGDDQVLVLNSGWRSTPHQRKLFTQAVQRYGSEREASRHVAAPERSSHVTGSALDVGPPEVAAWLDRNGARWGLCRTFANEGWHFELVADAAGRCPDLLPDASERP